MMPMTAPVLDPVDLLVFEAPLLALTSLLVVAETLMLSEWPEVVVTEVLVPFAFTVTVVDVEPGFGVGFGVGVVAL